MYRVSHWAKSIDIDATEDLAHGIGLLLARCPVIEADVAAKGWLTAIHY